ncbi:MAG: GNAT family N-acetyltransferase [Chloroflexi bacterium]|nr:GNAT family N-acetyltransferase [Chloroflexota bacterium]
MAVDRTQLKRIGTIWTLAQDQPVQMVRPLVDAQFARVGPEAAGELAAAGSLSPDEIERRFETGRWCYAARSGDRLAAYGWVSFGEEYVGELDLTLRLLPCEAYIWDCVTLPAFRQKYLYSALLAFMAEALKAESVCRIWIGADLDNQPSQRGIDRAGFQRIADLAAGPDGTDCYVMLPYPGVPDALAQEARRLFLSGCE